jgi:hypothetical protein
MLKIDLSGRRFGRLIVIKDAGRTKIGAVVWLCRCDCGAETNVPSWDLKSSNTASCGCGVGVKHGHTSNGFRSPTYYSWLNMIQRCTNSANTYFHNYGGRGITVCERWRNFENFLSDMGERPPHHTIDRIDNERSYQPDNCKWSTRKEQAKNKRKRRPHRPSS